MRKKLILLVSFQLILPTIFTLSAQQVPPVSNLWIDEDGKGGFISQPKESNDKSHQISLKALPDQQEISQTAPEISALNPGENLTFTAPYGYVYSHPNLRIFVRVINDGDAAATFTRLAYYLSTDASITKDDLFLGDDYVSTLSIGAHSDEEIIVDVTSYPGSWYTGFIIDYWEESIEDNENDNIWCSPQFTIPLSPPWGPILVSPADGATNVSINPRLYWRDGGGGLTDSYFLEVWDEATAAYGFSYCLSDTSKTVGPLSYNTRYAWMVQAGNSAGSNYSDCWHFTTEVDPLGNLPNVKCYDFLIVDNTGPDIEYITNLQNNSSAEVTSSFDNYIYLSQDKNINPSQDYWIDSWTCPPLVSYEYRGPDGGTRHITISSVPAGEYYLCWYIDANNVIEESDEDDNKIYVNDPKIIVASTSVEEPTEGKKVTESFILHQNYPNPFNASTEFQYFLPVKSHVQVTVHNIKGRIISHLDSGIKPAGTYSVTWDGYDVLKSPVCTGIYFIVLKAGDFTQTRKALLIR